MDIFLENSWGKYQMEMLVALTLIIYLYFYFKGKNSTESVVRKQLGQLTDTLLKHFAQVGGTGTLPLISDGPNNLFSYCTGNSLLDYCLISWNCLRRQDPLAYLYQIYSGATDELVIEIVPSKESAKQLIFAVASRRAEGEMRKEFYEIDKFCKKPNDAFYKYPSTLKIHTESNEIFDYFANSDLLAKIAECLPTFRYFVISDFPKNVPAQLSLCKYSSRVKLSFQVTKDCDFSKIAQLLSELLELLSNMLEQEVMSNAAKALVKRNRASFEESLLKEEYLKRSEDLSRKKLEEKREREMRVASLSHEAQRKHDQREQKKQLKKKTKIKVLKA